MTMTVDRSTVSQGITGHHGTERSPFPVARNAAATYLGLGLDELRDQLAQGQSLADLAQAQGKSVDGLKDALVSALKSAGAPSDADLASLVKRMVNARPGQDGPGPAPFGPPPGPPGGQAVEQAAADYLGTSTDDLRQQLQSGKSLADIAKSEGKSVDGLKDALMSALENAQSTNAASFLQALVDQMVTTQGPPQPPGVSVRA
ncbi:MAG: hypothetical protein U0807_11465 [Candidatus Binatia bacterium]